MIQQSLEFTGLIEIHLFLAGSCCIPVQRRENSYDSTAHDDSSGNYCGLSVLRKGIRRGQGKGNTDNEDFVSCSIL